MCLAGYTVNEEPNKGIIQRKQKLAEQMGVDISELSKPKEWPQETIEIHHPRRRTWYVVCETMEDKNAWLAQFKSCCRNAHGLKTREKVHEYAFAEAIRETRIALGHWESYSWGGSESDVLADLIAEEIDNTIMSRIYAKISGPSILRAKIRKTVVKAMNSAISSASSAAWSACEKAIAEVRNKVDPIIHNNIASILEKEEALTSKIKEGALAIITPVLKEHVTPHLAKIASICKSPITAAFDKATELFIQEVSKLNVSGSTKDEVKRSIYGLNYFTWWSISPALDKLVRCISVFLSRCEFTNSIISFSIFVLSEFCKLMIRLQNLTPFPFPICCQDVMLEALQALQDFFPDISAYTLIWDVREKLRARVDAACFSFEDRLLASIDVNPDLLRNNQALVATAGNIRAGVVEDLRHDAKIAARQFWIKLVKAIVKPPFEKLVIPACKDVVDPLVDLIPEPLKEIIDPHKALEQVLDDIINASIMAVIGEKA